MSTYFKPLRRKIGVLTLMAACVFAGMWIRSFIVADMVGVQIDDLTGEVIISTSGSIHWWEVSIPGGIDFTPLPTWTTATTSEARKAVYNPEFTWRWNGWMAFDYESKDPQIAIRGAMIPFWSFVIPLSLLSAGLLLWRTRSPIQSLAEPTAAGA